MFLISIANRSRTLTGW